MKFIQNYVILVVGCIFFSAFVQTALPDSPLKKTLRFILGLVLGIIIITPFAQFGAGELGISVPATPSAPPLSEEKQQQMETLMQQQAQSLYRQTLEDSIIRTIQEQNGEQPQVSVDCNENGEIRSVSIVSQDRTLPTLISQKFDIPIQKIHLQSQTTE